MSEHTTTTLLSEAMRADPELLGPHEIRDPDAAERRLTMPVEHHRYCPQCGGLQRTTAHAEPCSRCGGTGYEPR